MKAGFPVEQDNGLDSKICSHFGSAPGFILADTDSMTAVFISNRNGDHVHGMCQPLAAFQDCMPDAMVASGMGAGALSRLRESGIEVYLTPAGTVRAALEELRSGRLSPADPATACSMHGGGHGGGCGHKR